jgi:hypothetical protein
MLTKHLAEDLVYNKWLLLVHVVIEQSFPIENSRWLDVVVHTCDPSYVEGVGLRQKVNTLSNKWVK